jgi:hypothetical protein
VSIQEILVTAGQRTNQRAAGRHALAIMDTTDVLSPTQTASKRGFGLGSDGVHPGLFLHPFLGGGRDERRGHRAGGLHRAEPYQRPGQSGKDQLHKKGRKGNVFLKTALVATAITGRRRRGATYLAEKDRRLTARCGRMRAAVAIAP